MDSYQYVLTPVLAVCIAQLTKALLARAEGGSKRLLLVGMGGFPSAHTAGITSVTFLIFMTEGLSAPVSGLALAVSVVIVYDALNLRRSAGDIAEIVLAQNKETTKNKIARKRIARLRGHTPIEVIGGVLVGFIVAFTIFGL